MWSVCIINPIEEVVSIELLMYWNMHIDITHINETISILFNGLRDDPNSCQGHAFIS